MWAIILSGSFTAASPRPPPADIAEEPAQALAAFIAGVATAAGVAADPSAYPDVFAADGDPLLAADAAGVVVTAAAAGAAGAGAAGAGAAAASLSCRL